MADRGRDEHLHCHYGTNSAAVALLCRLLGGPPYSFTMHGPEEFDSPRALSLRDKIHHAAFVVAISEFTRSQLYRWADHADWPKIKVVRCGVDAMFLGPSGRRSGRPPAGQHRAGGRAEGADAPDRGDGPADRRGG